MCSSSAVKSLTGKSQSSNTPENYTHWDHTFEINLFHDVVWCAPSWYNFSSVLRQVRKFLKRRSPATAIYACSLLQADKCRSEMTLGR
jgi:hypothetical protein